MATVESNNYKDKIFPCSASVKEIINETMKVPENIAMKIRAANVQTDTDETTLLIPESISPYNRPWGTKTKITEQKLETLESLMKDLITEMSSVKKIVESKNVDEKVAVLETKVEDGTKKLLSIETKVDSIINSRAYRVIKFLCWE